MKRGLLGLLPIFFINFVSAQFFGAYGRFSIGNFFDRIDPQTMMLGALFIIFFAFINMATSKIFKDSYGYPNRATAGIVAFVISGLIIYGLYRTGFDLTNLFYDLGLSADSLYIIIPIIFLIGAIIASFTIGLGAFLAVVGLLLILLTVFTQLFYEKGVTLALGVLLLLIGWWFWRRKRLREGKTGGGAPRGRPRRRSSREPGFLRRKWGDRKSFRYDRKAQKKQKEYLQGQWQRHATPEGRREKYKGKREKLEARKEAKIAAQEEKYKYRDAKWTERGHSTGKRLGKYWKRKREGFGALGRGAKKIGGKFRKQ